MPGGPPPKPADQRRRRNATLPMTQLPAAGWDGPAPSWPLAGVAPAMWPELWSCPQAAAWVRLGSVSVRMVARYAVLFSQPDWASAPTILGELRQLEDRLGLNPLAMLRLRWEVAADEVLVQRAVRDEPAPSPARRLKVADAVAGG